MLWGENSAEWTIAFFGCLLSGAVIVPVDHASTKEFAGRVAREAGAKLVFRSSELPEPEGTAGSVTLESVEEMGERKAERFEPPELKRGDTLEIIFTSGTTAEPRGVVLTHGNVLANIEPIDREMEKYLKYEKYFHPIRFLNLLPLSHVFGQIMGVFLPPLLGGTTVFPNTLKPSELIEAIRRERVSVLVAVPRFVESLQREILRDVEREGRSRKFQETFESSKKLHFLKRWWKFRREHRKFGWKFWAFICGGAALPEDSEAFWKRLGYAVIQGYGMTETTSLISLNHPFRSEQGSIGRVFPGMEVKVDENGEILVRGENVATAYRHQGETRSVSEADGWFRTGDLAEQDGEGRLFFKGRRKNVIVTSAGMNIYPEDLEKALRGEAGVRDCVVVGIENGGNAEACAVLLLDAAGRKADVIVEGANRSLAEYQKIRRWHVWPEADFPRTSTQKPILPVIREAARRAGEGAQAAAGGTALAALISQITGRAVQADAASTRLEADLQLSSVDRVELIGALEERYQVELSETKFEEVATIGQLEKLIAEGPTTRVEHVFPRWPQSRAITAIRLLVYYTLAWPATYVLAAPKVIGREKLRGVKGPVLVMTNHVTYLDIAWVLPALPGRMRNRLATAMGGERLARMRRPARDLPFYERWWERLDYFLVCSLFNVFPLPQKSGFLEAFGFAGDLADRGWNILVFPEGQTTVDGKMVAFRKGAGILAKQLKLPVVPMYLDGLYPLKVKRRILAGPGKVRVVVGEPMHFDAEQDVEEITREIEKRVKELQPT